MSSGARLALYRVAGRQPVAILAADAAPQHVTFGAHAAYVASGAGRTLSVHALADGGMRHARVRRWAPTTSRAVPPRY